MSCAVRGGDSLAAFVRILGLISVRIVGRVLRLATPEALAAGTVGATMLSTGNDNFSGPRFVVSAHPVPGTVDKARAGIFLRGSKVGR